MYLVRRRLPITDDAAFGDVGSQIGIKWMQVNLGKGGTYKNLKGKIFESASDLLAFYRDRTKRETDTEACIRVAPAKLTVTFTKGADDVTGEMTSQVYDISTAKTLSKNAYTRVGHPFSYWKNSEGNRIPRGKEVI